MKLYSYVVKQDTGLAPNPFHGVLTLALCTPNHQRIKAAAGDWIVGNATKARGPKLVYAMRVCERLGLNDYFNDARFAIKQPRFTGNWKDWSLGVGDNIYFRDKHGEWQQVETKFHCDDDDLFRKDTEGDTVFIADEFYYFGDALPVVPEAHRGVLRQTQGCATVETETALRFLDWLRSNFKQGVHGKPSDWKDAAQKM
jgi:hypothetical protein